MMNCGFLMNFNPFKFVGIFGITKIYRIGKIISIHTKERVSVSVSEQIISGDIGYGKKSLETIATGNKSGYLYGVFSTNDRKI